MPSASASRRAGSTVSTSTRPPMWVAAVAAIAAAVVVLPTPPEPQTSTISLAASMASRPGAPSRARGISRRLPTSVGDLIGERLGDERDDAPAGRPRVQLGDDDRVEAGRKAVAEPLEVAGSDLGATFRDPGRLDHGPHGPPGGLDEHRLDARSTVASRSNTVALAVVEEAVQHPVGDDRAGGDAGLGLEPADAGRASR